ncbi:MAG: universal stress protein [Halanaeroarchaeum sp.]
MEILVPVDGSDCSLRALRQGLDMAERYDGTVHVVHFTDVESASTSELEERVESVLREHGAVGDMEIVGDVRLGTLKASDRVGSDILAVVEERGYDHVVMGHHGSGMVGEALLGSAAKTVVEDGTVPVTIVP